MIITVFLYSIFLMFNVVDSETGYCPASMVVNSIFSLDGEKKDLEAAC